MKYLLSCVLIIISASSFAEDNKTKELVLENGLKIQNRFKL